MTQTQMKNLNFPQELKKLAQTHQGFSINQLRVILALERAVARLQAHPTLSKHLIFKGGFVLLKTLESSRFTRDLDALGIGLSRSRLPAMLENALKTNLRDSLFYTAFDHRNLEDQGDYGGLRFSCAFQVGPLPTSERKLGKLSRIHIDIGFGDVVTNIRGRKMKSIVSGIDPISWRVYPPEHIFSEKLQTFFERGSANSRAKDLLDLTLIYPKCQNRDRLLRAIRKTFTVRSTPLPDSFLKMARTFDQTVLQSAWKSIQTEHDVQFSRNWKAFETILRALDLKSEMVRH